MVISIHKLIPLLTVGMLANHSKDAIDKRLAAMNFSPRQFVAKQSMKNILYSIRLRTIGEVRVKFEPDVPRYIRKIAESEMGDPARDPWGTFYKLYQKGNYVHIESFGPDRQHGTKDDLKRMTELLNY